MASVPTIPTGKIGQSTSSDRRAAPVRPLCSVPSRLRVPSGKMPNSSPRCSTPAAVSSADDDFSPPARSIGIIPIAGKTCLVFHESMYSALPTKLLLRGIVSIRNAESRNEMWLGHRIAGPVTGKRTVVTHHLDVPQPACYRRNHAPQPALGRPSSGILAEHHQPKALPPAPPLTCAERGADDRLTRLFTTCCKIPPAG